MDESSTPTAVGSNAELGHVDRQTIDCWRTNYGLDKTPHELHAYWGAWAPAGAVLALKAAVGEIERLTAALKAANDQAERFERGWYLRGDALEQYANPLNWNEDSAGTRRVWLEPGSSTPAQYNGFEAARAALKA